MRSSTGGRPLSPAGVSNLASVSTSVLSWPAASPASAAASLLALASAAAACTASSAASVSRLDVGDLGHQLLAALGRSLELGGVGRAADDLAGLGVERDELALELGDLLVALAPLRLQALAAGAGFGRGDGELAQARLGALEVGFGLVESSERLCSNSPARRAVLASDIVPPRGAQPSPWPRRSATARAPCRGRAARRGPRTPSAGRRCAAPRAPGSPARS